MEKFCAWKQDGYEDSDTYETDCGHSFMLNEGTPKENDLMFCCFCGHPIDEILFEIDDEECATK